MARVAGKDADFSFNGVAIESQSNNIVMTVAVPEVEITAFADAYGNFLAGKKNVTTEITGTLDMASGAADITIFEAIGGGTKSIVFDPTGSGPGANAPEFQCTASGLTGGYVASHHISLPVGDKASFSTTFQHSGQTTRAVA